jgi:hypothetical protein
MGCITDEYGGGVQEDLALVECLADELIVELQDRLLEVPNTAMNGLSRPGGRPCV